tara:strand:- start:386 stop:1525 length:1140 start_codon:yes stop_codon:yes gene_type:complete
MAGHGSYSKTYTEDFNTAISKGKTRSEALKYASEQRDLGVENTKKREEGYGVNYDDRGGLPKSLRYPYSAIEEGMDFLKISIATYTAPKLDLQGLATVSKKEKDLGINDILDDGSQNATIERGTGSFDLRTATQSNAGPLKNPKHTIYLPIPRQIQDANSVQYDSGKLDPLEAVGAALIQTGIENPSFGLISDTLRLLTESGTDVVTQNTDAIAAAIAGRAIGALGGNVTANQLIARASGAILNPNLESLFQGVKLRQFPFTFEFFPRNHDEGQQVKMIIKVLKRSMAARNNKKKGKGIFIKQPDIFQLEYMKGSSEHPFLNKFLPSHLTDMKINYSQSGTYSTFHDGTPTHMTVSCSFQEVNPVYQEDYDNAGEGVGY